MSTHIPPRSTYVQPVPSALMMMSMTETRAAPREQRTILFCKKGKLTIEMGVLKNRLTHAVTDEP